jgi:hypothetical protein
VNGAIELVLGKHTFCPRRPDPSVKQNNEGTDSNSPKMVCHLTKSLVVVGFIDYKHYAARGSPMTNACKLGYGSGQGMMDSSALTA